MANRRLAQAEVQRRLRAIVATGGNISEASRHLGIPRQRLSMWYHRHLKQGGEAASDAQPREAAPRGRRRVASVRAPDPEEFLRTLLYRLDELRTELTLRSERVKELEQKLARAEADLSYYKDQDNRRREEWQRELAKRTAELSMPTD